MRSNNDDGLKYLKVRIEKKIICRDWMKPKVTLTSGNQSHKLLDEAWKDHLSEIESGGSLGYMQVPPSIFGRNWLKNATPLGPGTDKAL